MDLSLNRLINNAIKFLLCLFIFLIPLQTRYLYSIGKINGDISEYTTLSLYANEIILLAILILYISLGTWRLIIHPAKKVKFTEFFKRIAANPPHILFPVILLLWSGISIIWANNKIIAWHRWTIFLEGIIIFLFLAKEKIINSKKIIIIFMIGAIIQSALSIKQFSEQYIYSNKYLGISAQNPANLGTSVVETFNNRWLRSYGSFPHPNILGAYFIIILLLILTSYSKVKSALSLDKNFSSTSSCSHSNNISEFFFIFFIWLIGLSLLLTFSRSAWLAGGISIILILITFRKNKILNQKYYKPLSTCYAKIFLVLFLSLSFSLAVFFLRTPIFSRIANKSRLEIKSSQERILSYKESFGIIKQNWLLGVGAGNYVLALYNKNPQFKSYNYQPVHNLFLLIWAELGFIGLLIFILFLFYTIKNIKNQLPQLILCVTILILASFDHYFWTLHPGVMLLWVSMGLINI